MQELCYKSHLLLNNSDGFHAPQVIFLSQSIAVHKYALPVGLGIQAVVF